MFYRRLLQIRIVNTYVNHRGICLSSSSSNIPQKEIKLGFLGTGRIAQALIIGLLNKEKLRPEQIYVNDENKEYLTRLREKTPLFQVRIKFALKPKPASCLQ